MFTHHDFADLRDRIQHARRRHSGKPLYIALRPDVHRDITMHFEGNGRSWNNQIDGLICIVRETKDEFEIEYEAPELGGPEE